MKTIKMLVPAPPHTIFTDETAESMIGKPFTAKVEDKPVGEGHVIAATLIDDRTAVEIIVEWPDK